MSVVVTRMQDLASEFSNIIRGLYPGPPQREGQFPRAPTPARPQDASAPVLGPKPWSPHRFSRGCAPVANSCISQSSQAARTQLV